MPEMKIKAITPWFGGKRTLVPTIIEELGPHKAYWEPFCGGVSILLQKDRARLECLNDLHGDLTNLARVLASDGCPELYDRCVRTLYSEGLFEESKASIGRSPVGDEPNIDRAFHYLVLSWMGRNGAAGTARINYQFTMRYTGNGGDSATRWANVTTSIPAWHDRLRGVVISRKDGIELVSKIDDADEVVIYLDPPYLNEGGAYEHTFHSGGGMFGDDHLRLATEVRRFKKARVVVSYYANDRLAELYPGWTVRDCTMNKALHVQNKRGAEKSEAPEILIINGPSYAKGAA
jgi:DNA adenine methylase